MKILVVDDDRIVRLLFRKILEHEPECEIIEAGNGVEAWKLLQEGLRPDACFLDTMMPQMDGVELLQRMRSDRRFNKFRVIMCTAVNERSRVIEAKSLDIDSYLLKPLIPARILGEIRRLRGITPTSQPSETPSDLYQRVIKGLV